MHRLRKRQIVFDAISDILPDDFAGKLDVCKFEIPCFRFDGPIWPIVIICRIGEFGESLRWTDRAVVRLRYQKFYSKHKRFKIADLEGNPERFLGHIADIVALRSKNQLANIPKK